MFGKKKRLQFENERLQKTIEVLQSENLRWMRELKAVKEKMEVDSAEVRRLEGELKRARQFNNMMLYNGHDQNGPEYNYDA